MLSYTEIVKRLANGEDPLDLSIEAWKRKVAWLEAGNDPLCLPIDWRHCPLCIHGRTTHYSTWCDACAYYLHHGHPCFHDGPYVQIERIIDHDVKSAGVVLDLAREMVAELEQIREAHSA